MEPACECLSSPPTLQLICLPRGTEADAFRGSKNAISVSANKVVHSPPAFSDKAVDGMTMIVSADTLMHRVSWRRNSGFAFTAHDSLICDAVYRIERWLFPPPRLWLLGCLHY
jgi:hypothetical protein